MTPGSRRAAIFGLAAVAIVFLWQAVTVHYVYGGNWTSLFCISPHAQIPEYLKSENLYVPAGTFGYDGQFYHLIAHDPLMRRNPASAFDDAPFRYQRIFVPALAWVIAFGQDRWIHLAYFTVILGFVFLGVYWTARYAERAGRSPAWGLLFAITPAAATSVDRMTVDVALAAFIAGFAWYCERPGWRVFTILTCAALTRETAIPVIAAYALYLVSQKQITRAILAGCTALPAAAWFLYLHRHGQPNGLPGFVHWTPLAGLIERMIHPVVYTLSPMMNGIVRMLDEVALAGVALALIFAAMLAMRRRWDAESCAIYALAVAVVFLESRAVWEEVYAFGRVLTPLLLLTALRDLKREEHVLPWLAFLPIFLVDSRLSLYFISRLFETVRAIGHW